MTGGGIVQVRPKEQYHFFIARRTFFNGPIWDTFRAMPLTAYYVPSDPPRCSNSCHERWVPRWPGAVLHADQAIAVQGHSSKMERARAIGRGHLLVTIDWQVNHGAGWAKPCPIPLGVPSPREMTLRPASSSALWNYACLFVVA